jgi:hypothetical protein
MFKLMTLLFTLLVTAGCEILCDVAPASGRVVDAKTRQPIRGATVTRVDSEAPGAATTNGDGRFRLHGKHSVQFFPFGDAWVHGSSYRIEATGYQIFETNRFFHLPANQSGCRVVFEEIGLNPK